MTGHPEGTELFLVCRRFDQSRPGVVLGFIREGVLSLFLHTSGVRFIERLQAGVRSKKRLAPQKAFLTLLDLRMLDPNNHSANPRLVLRTVKASHQTRAA